MPEVVPPSADAPLGFSLHLDEDLLTMPGLHPTPRSVFGLHYTPAYGPRPSMPLPSPLRIFTEVSTFTFDDHQPSRDVTRELPFIANLSSQFDQFHFRGTSFGGFGVGLAVGFFDNRLGLGVMGGIPGLGSGILSIKLGQE